jgi:hypothetical protein
MRTDVMGYMQNTYVVGGKLAMEGKLAIALINRRGPFAGPLQWEEGGEGQEKYAVAYATHEETGEVLRSIPITMKMADAEKWTKNNKWTSMPDQMLRYRSAAFFGRAYCPDILMGMLTKDEADDLVASGQLSEVAESRRKADDLSARILAAEKSIQDAPRQLSAAQAPEVNVQERAAEVAESRRKADDLSARILAAEKSIQDAPRQLSAAQAPEVNVQERAAEQREPVPNKPAATAGEQPKAATEPQPDVAGVISKMQAETEQCSECQTREEATRCAQAVRAKYQGVTEPWPAAAKEQFAQAYMQSVDVVNKAFKEQEQPAEPVQDKPEGDPPAPAIGSPKLFP